LFWVDYHIWERVKSQEDCGQDFIKNDKWSAYRYLTWLKEQIDPTFNYVLRGKIMCKITTKNLKLKDITHNKYLLKSV